MIYAERSMNDYNYRLHQHTAALIFEKKNKIDKMWEAFDKAPVTIEIIKTPRILSKKKPVQLRATSSLKAKKPKRKVGRHAKT
jgi:hypothetical protein